MRAQGDGTEKRDTAPFLLASLGIGRRYDAGDRTSVRYTATGGLGDDKGGISLNVGQGTSDGLGDWEPRVRESLDALHVEYGVNEGIPVTEAEVRQRVAQLAADMAEGDPGAQVGYAVFDAEGNELPRP